MKYLQYAAVAASLLSQDTVLVAAAPAPLLLHDFMRVGEQVGEQVDLGHAFIYDFLHGLFLDGGTYCACGYYGCHQYQ